MEGLSGWVNLIGSARLGQSGVGLPGWVSPDGFVRLGPPGWVCLAGSVRMGLPGWVRPTRVMYELQLQKVITSSFELRFECS